MAKQTINPGVAPTGAGGDTFRSGSAKLQANDDELYAAFGASGGVLPPVLPISKGGTGADSASWARANLGLGTAATYNIESFVRTGDMVYHESIQASGMYIYTPEYMPSGLTLAYNYGVVIKASHGFAGTRAEICIPHTEGAMGTLQYRAATIMPWKRIRDSGNTTVDSNGFIKAASPIVQLFADKIKLNDEAQQQSIEFEKLGVGDYLVKGSLGFAQEGWYVETPKDANGNVLFSVIYTTLENGDISVKTYKKKFDFETGSIVADLDNPVDITENRWIDLRLQELPQPETEVADDPEQ